MKEGAEDNLPFLDEKDRIENPPYDPVRLIFRPVGLAN